MTKFLSNIDLNQNQLLNTVLQNLAVAPPSPREGQMYYNTATQRAYICTNPVGPVWQEMDGLSAAMTAADIVNTINGSSLLIDNDNLSAAVNDAIAKAHNTHTIDMVTGLETALDGKVDNSQVLTNVPAGAVFTDTVTTINGKTGIITKADITALGIPGQDTTYSVFTSTTNGLAPLSGGGTTKYLRADGTWTVPPNTIYTLPVAGTVLGGVKSGTDITVDVSGNVSVNDDSHNHIISNVDGLQAALDAKETPAGALAKATTAENNAKAYTDTQINNVIGAAPGTLDTLNELAAALGDDPNFATTVTNQIAAKTGKYVATVGDGTNTSFTLTHNRNTRDVVVTIRETGAPYAQVITDVEMTTVNTVAVKFASAPTSGQYTVTIVG